MKYKNGKDVKKGDLVAFLVTGPVMTIQDDTGQIAVGAPQVLSQTSGPSNLFLLAEDAEIVEKGRKGDGSESPVIGTNQPNVITPPAGKAPLAGVPPGTPTKTQPQGLPKDHPSVQKPPASKV